jgi:hypothetical protein
MRPSGRRLQLHAVGEPDRALGRGRMGDDRVATRSRDATRRTVRDAVERSLALRPLRTPGRAGAATISSPFPGTQPHHVTGPDRAGQSEDSCRGASRDRRPAARGSCSTA